MRYKSTLMVLAALGFLSLFVFKDAVLYRLGIFLVVEDRPAGRVDVAVVSDITEKVVHCYKAGNCGKILIVAFDSDVPWKSGEKNSVDMEIREQAKMSGIDPADLIVHPGSPGGTPYMVFLRELLLQQGVHSAIFYTSYHKGRRFRFYLDRYLKNTGIVTYVQPAVNSDYMRNFDRWWENTALDNLFLGEYLGMLFYYFNKVLWSSAV